MYDQDGLLVDECVVDVDALNDEQMWEEAYLNELLWEEACREDQLWDEECERVMREEMTREMNR